jgi:SHS2 domain-containing protein
MVYRVFDHTADLGVEVAEASLEDLYAGASLALFDLLTDLSAVRETEERTLSVEGEGPDDLLINFLREILYIWNGEGFLIKRCTIREVAPRRLTALLWGEPYDPARHRIRMEIKAVTYHQASVSRADTGWIARVVFDV